MSHTKLSTYHLKTLLWPRKAEFHLCLEMIQLCDTASTMICKLRAVIPSSCPKFSIVSAKNLHLFSLRVMQASNNSRNTYRILLSLVCSWFWKEHYAVQEEHGKLPAYRVTGNMHSWYKVGMSFLTRMTFWWTIVDYRAGWPLFCWLLGHSFPTVSILS